MKKELQGSLTDGYKEPVIERISQLANKYSSRSAAARAWGVNINTLNSYFKSDIEPPMPRDNVLSRIAEHEGVSLEWLKSGNTIESPKTITSSVGDDLSKMLSFLTDDERQKLTVTLARKGVEIILYLLEDANIKLLQSDEQVKNRMLAVIGEGVKKESGSSDRDVAEQDQSSDNKMAG